MLRSDDGQAACTGLQGHHRLPFIGRRKQQEACCLEQSQFLFLTHPAQGVNEIILSMLQPGDGEANRRTMLVKGMSDFDCNIMAFYRVWSSKEKQMMLIPRLSRWRHGLWNWI